MNEYVELSKEFYQGKTFEEYWRRGVFFLRSLLHRKKMQSLLHFFRSTPLLCELTRANPIIFEQATRHWFYYNSTFSERADLLTSHYRFMVSHFREDIVRQMYLNNGVFLWEQAFQDSQLTLHLHFEDCHKKEGTLALELKLNNNRVYQVIFWIAPAKDGSPALWIGALQGSQHGLEINKQLTKRFFGYRPKNFILHSVRTLAHSLDIEKIYAVSNAGFYTNNHVRLDRKLKTSLDSFWEESGGTLCPDRRFYQLPVFEARKTIDAVESHKRNQYRKRFAFLDTFDTSVVASVTALLNILSEISL